MTLRHQQIVSSVAAELPPLSVGKVCWMRATMGVDADCHRKAPVEKKSGQRETDRDATALTRLSGAKVQ
jgi:hypothetical protein